jgi:hypothetical protein
MLRLLWYIIVKRLQLKISGTWTWKSSLIRSKGADAVLAIAPAVPPARNILSQHEDRALSKTSDSTDIQTHHGSLRCFCVMVSY